MCGFVIQSSPRFSWHVEDRLQLLALEAELAKFPRLLIPAVWEVLHQIKPTKARPNRYLDSFERELPTLILSDRGYNPINRSRNDSFQPFSVWPGI